MGEIASSKPVQKEGISYLERMFKNKTVHDSLIVLLKGAVRDHRFLADSKVFGVDWIKYTITSQDSKDALKDLVVNTFVKDQRVIQSSANLCKYFVQQPETKELAKIICSASML